MDDAEEEEDASVKTVPATEVDDDVLPTFSLWLVASGSLTSPSFDYAPHTQSISYVLYVLHEYRTSST